MTENEISRAVQYVTARTSHGYDAVSAIIRTGLTELAAIATSSSRSFQRETLVEYVCRWTMTRTGQPEPLVREVLGCAGRWLDEMYETMIRERPDLLKDR
ncbi:MAG: hypothetical protein ACREJU_03245 [Nitrospiraceae bacterium]